MYYENAGDKTRDFHNINKRNLFSTYSKVTKNKKR